VDADVACQTTSMRPLFLRVWVSKRFMVVLPEEIIGERCRGLEARTANRQF